MDDASVPFTGKSTDATDDSMGSEAARPDREIRPGSGRLRLHILAMVIAGPALLTACGGQDRLNDSSDSEEANGEIAGIRGDWAVATPLFIKAYQDHPDALSEFNLATAYENTGQNDKATALYEAVVIDGYYTHTRLILPTGGKDEPNEAVFLSDEATNRMVVMASRKALLDRIRVAANSKASPVKQILICDFPDRNGAGASRFGQIVVNVDDQSGTASTLGFLAVAPSQQEVDHFSASDIAWTQRYKIAGVTTVYHYELNRPSGSLDVTRPAPDASKEVKVNAVCHQFK